MLLLLFFWHLFIHTHTYSPETCVIFFVNYSHPLCFTLSWIFVSLICNWYYRLAKWQAFCFGWNLLILLEIWIANRTCSVELINCHWRVIGFPSDSFEARRTLLDQHAHNTFELQTLIVIIVIFAYEFEIVQHEQLVTSRQFLLANVTRETFGVENLVFGASHQVGRTQGLIATVAFGSIASIWNKY